LHNLLIHLFWLSQFY